VQPAADERLIFVDLNAEADFKNGEKPGWADWVIKRLERFEASELPAGTSAYLFVTNLIWHSIAGYPTSRSSSHCDSASGIADFNKPGRMRLTEAYRCKKRHVDAYAIADAFAQYINFLSTFDGSIVRCSALFDQPSVSRRVCNRQQEAEAGAAVGRFVVGSNLSAVCLDDRSGNRQAHAHAGVFGGEKPVK
jgi:hypothetical protein